MKLESGLARDVKRASKEDGFRRKVFDARMAMSTPMMTRERLSDAIQKYGRVAVTICTGATICARNLYGPEREWAEQVLTAWGHPQGDENACIHDNLHSTRILEYAGSFIRMNSESEA